MTNVAPPKEFEIKLETEPASLRRLNKVPLIKALSKSPRHATEITVYFDTDKRKLQKNGFTLRVRRIGKRHIQTIKSTAPIERNEWETDIRSAAPDLNLIGGTPLDALLTKKMRHDLKPMFETHIRRTIYSDDERAIELTIDRGKIDTGDDATPVCELELELKQGRKDRLFEMARTLVHALPAQISLKSKAERGYEFIARRLGSPVKSAPVDIPTTCNVRDAFKIIGFACLKQVIDNVPALIKGDPEGVHQMRVGLRRLRVAMSLFGTLLHDDQTTAIKAELKWLTGELTPAREFEVLTERVLAPITQQHGNLRNGVPAFSKLLARKRKAALARAKEAVLSDRFRTLTFEVAAWLEVGDWTKPEDDLVRNRGDVAIDVFAAEQLQQRSRKIRKRGKKLAQFDAGKRHKFRIQVKKIRYAGEFFGELFQRKKARKRQKKFLAALKRLQGGLGELNDIAVDGRLIASASPPDSTFAAGLLVGHEEAGENDAIKAAIEGYARLVEVKPFWR